MTLSEFKLPDVGEGLTEAEIVSWKVKPGDAVKVNDVIVEIETAKSLVELPSPYAGVVDALLVDEGTTVDVGTPIIRVQTEASGGERSGGPPSESHQTAPSSPSARPSQASDGGPPERQAVLVGYGPRTGTSKRRKRRTPQEANGSATSEAETSAAPEATQTKALAKPPVRKLAKDMGVDINSVAPSGPNGTVTRDDVRAAAETPAAAAVEIRAAGWHGQPREERVPIRSVRKATAEAVSKSAFTAPHVTEFVTVDVTRTMKLVNRLRSSREFSDIKLSPLAVVARALCVAVPRNPDVNSRWDGDSGEIVVQRYINLGIAAATPRGLVVPNIKDAQELPLRELASAINELAGTARAGKTPPDDMLGGTISITNVGVFGVDTGTPILPPGEAAILAVGAIKKQPWVHKGKIKPRWVTTLALSFDHRLVDGEAGSKFLAEIAGLLEEPGNALAWS